MPLARTSLLLFVAAATVAFLAPGGSAAQSSSAKRQPPCTKRAIQKGLHRGPAKIPGAKVAGTFECAGKFAGTGIQVGRDAGVALLHAKRGHWISVSRATYCPDVPKPVRNVCFVS